MNRSGPGFVWNHVGHPGPVVVEGNGLAGSGFSPVYSMCKFWVVGFVKSLALRLASEKIR